MACRGPDYYDDDSETISILKSEINKLTKILCDISKLPKDTTVGLLNGKVSYYDEFIKEHIKNDENRWYETYKKIYPNFNKSEIIKMVRSVILKD